MTEEQIKHMVDRFLSWDLPADFYPDGGISFTPSSSSWPTGTNVLDATQAEAMIRHMVKGLDLAQDNSVIEKMAGEAEEGNLRVWSDSPDSGKPETDTTGDLADWLRSFKEPPLDR